VIQDDQVIAASVHGLDHALPAVGVEVESALQCLPRTRHAAQDESRSAIRDRDRTSVVGVFPVPFREDEDCPQIFRPLRERLVRNAGVDPELGEQHCFRLRGVDDPLVRRSTSLALRSCHDLRTCSILLVFGLSHACVTMEIWSFPVLLCRLLSPDYVRSVQLPCLQLDVAVMRSWKCTFSFIATPQSPDRHHVIGR
jgi:hypothetical protein